MGKTVKVALHQRPGQFIKIPARPDDAYDPAGTAAATMAAHEAAVDPHPGYLTAAEGAAAFDALGAAAAAQAAAQSYADGLVTGLWEVKGGMDCSANPNYPAASKGDAYVVIVAGKIGGASGISVDVGDVFVAFADNAGGTEAAVGSSWENIEHNLQDVATIIHAASSKATPVDADELGLVDSAASNVLKKLTWANLKATLKSYFDTVYQAASAQLLSLAGLSYTGNALKVVRVNAGETGFELASGGGSSVSVYSTILVSNTVVATTTETTLLSVSLPAGTYVGSAQLMGSTAGAISPEWFITDLTTIYGSGQATWATGSAYMQLIQTEKEFVLATTTTIYLRVKHAASTSVTYLANTSTNAKPKTTTLRFLKIA